MQLDLICIRQQLTERTDGSQTDRDDRAIFGMRSGWQPFCLKRCPSGGSRLLPLRCDDGAAVDAFKADHIRPFQIWAQPPSARVICASARPIVFGRKCLDSFRKLNESIRINPPKQRSHRRGILCGCNNSQPRTIGRNVRGDESMLRVVHKSGKCGVPTRDTCHFTISSTGLEGPCAPGSSAPSLSLLSGGGGSLKMNSKYGGAKRPLHVMCSCSELF